MEIAEDRWLAERLGRPAFTIRNPAEVETPLPRTLEPGFYQARVPGARVDVVRLLQERGFYVTNAALTLGRPPGEEPSPAGIEVGPVDPRHHGTLLGIAGSSFHSSRFHLDPLVPMEVAHRIKRDWVDSYLRGTRGEELLVARVGGEPAGFLAVIGGEEGGRTVRTIDLIGVAQERQGSGAGAALVARLLADSVGRCDEVRVGTQAANAAATRFYERLGFEAVAMAYDLHLHA